VLPGRRDSHRVLPGRRDSHRVLPGRRGWHHELLEHKGWHHDPLEHKGWHHELLERKGWHHDPLVHRDSLRAQQLPGSTMTKRVRGEGQHREYRLLMSVWTSLTDGDVY